MNEPHVPFSVEYIFALSMRSLVSARRPRLVGLGDGRGRFEGGPRASRFRSTYMPDIWLDGREMDWRSVTGSSQVTPVGEDGM